MTEVSGLIKHDKFVLIGAIPLFVVTNLEVSENYKLPAIGKDNKSQWLGKIEETITVNGFLVGRDRLFFKLGLEAMADLSMLLNLFVPIPGLSGIPFVSGLTTLTDMQITSLKFTQSTQDFGAIGVVVSLKHCPRGLVAELIGQGLNLASSLAGAGIQMSSGTRTVGGPIG